MKNKAKNDKHAAVAAGNSSTEGSGAAQEFSAVQERKERCQLCRCKVRWLQIKKKLGGKRIGLVDCCRGKEQCGGRVTWHSGHGRSENGSETMHKTCCVC